MARKRKGQKSVSAHLRQMERERLSPEQAALRIQSSLEDLSVYRRQLDAAFKVLGKGLDSVALISAWEACRDLSGVLDRLMSLDKVAKALRDSLPKTPAEQPVEFKGKIGRVIWTGQSRKPGSHGS